MTGPSPLPPGDEPVPAVPTSPTDAAGSPADDAPQVDSFAAEQPAEAPSDAATPPAAPPSDPADPPGTEPADGSGEAARLDSFAAEAPAEPSDAVTADPGAGAAPVSDQPSSPAAPPSAEPSGATDVAVTPTTPAVDPLGGEPSAPVAPPAPDAEAAQDAPSSTAGITVAPDHPSPPGSGPAEPAAPVSAASPSLDDDDTPPAPDAAPVTPATVPATGAATATAAAAAVTAPEAPGPGHSKTHDADAVAAAPRSGRRSWVPVVAVGAAVAVLAGGTAALAWQLRQQALAEDAAVDAVAAARDAARVLFSYDHTKLAEDFEKGLALTTGDFRDEYRRTTTEVVTPVAEQYDAVVVAEVVEAAVVDASASEVTALVFLNQGTTSTRVQGQQVDQSRVRMRLVERDGRWLVEEVQAL